MATNKRFKPLGSTAPTAGQTLPDTTTPQRPDADPFKAPEPVAPKPRDAQTLRANDVTKAVAGEVITPEHLEGVTAELTEAEAAIIRKLMKSPRLKVKKEEKVAFTWRISLEQADMLDRWAMDLRRKIGVGRLDRSVLLAAIVDEVSGRPDVLDAVASRLHKS